MSDTDYYSTVIITDDLGLSNHSQVPLKTNSQFVEVELLQLLKNSESKQIYKVKSKSENGSKFFYSMFDNLLLENDYIVYLTQSFDEANVARTKHRSKDRIFIIDTKTISAGVILIKNYLLTILKEELTVKESIPKVLKYIDRTKSKIILKNKSNRWFIKPLINFEEHISISNKFKFANTIVDMVLDQEYLTHINQIYLTYSLDSLSVEAENIKRYLEFKLRYFDKVKLVKETQNLRGLNNINGFGLYLG
jgi:hypothetical protein